MRRAGPDRADIPPYEALLAIKSSSGADGMTVGEISERLQVKHHTVVSLLDKLEARKLATRKRATTDRRNVNVQLTKAGASLLAVWPQFIIANSSSAVPKSSTLFGEYESKAGK